MNKSGRGACPRSSNPSSSGGKPLFLTCSIPVCSFFGDPDEQFVLEPGTLLLYYSPEPSCAKDPVVRAL